MTITTSMTLVEADFSERSAPERGADQGRAASAITNWTVVSALDVVKSTSKPGNSGSSEVSSQGVGEFAGMIGHRKGDFPSFPFRR